MLQVSEVYPLVKTGDRTNAGHSVWGAFEMSGVGPCASIRASWYAPRAASKPSGRARPWLRRRLPGVCTWTVPAMLRPASRWHRALGSRRLSLLQREINSQSEGVCREQMSGSVDAGREAA